MWLRLGLVLIMFSGQLCLPAWAAAAPVSGGLELTELLPDPAAPLTDEHDEFVEFHNAGASPVNLHDYKLQVGAKTYALPSQTVAPDGYAALTAATVSWALTNAGGTASLLDAGSQTLDTTTWPAAVTGAGWAKGAGGAWAWTTTPTTGAANVMTASTPTPGKGSDTSAPVAPGPYAALEITELLPDPASPQSDTADEFIELYNPNADSVDVNGYTLKTGRTLTDHYSLPSLLVAPGSYVAFKSAQTHLSLANTGSSAALFDPAGHQVGETISYTAPKSGQAWAWSETGWTWTTTPTPGAANVIAAPAATGAASATSSSATKKPTATKASSSSSSKSTTKAKSTTAPAPAASGKTQTAAARLANPSGYWLLFILGGLTIGYVIYEFRHDLRHYYHRLRGHAGRSGQAGSAPEGRGSRRAGQRSGRRQDNLRAGADAGVGV